jgi:glutamyl-tRNA synthetase
MPDPIVGRLAPSPTGLLHLGHARSFLLAWWQIRAAGGRILLRMEDLDTERTKPGMVDAVFRDLEWLGLDWDGEVVYQSERHALYTDALTKLIAAGRAYPCTCTRKEIEEAQSAPHAGDDGQPYPGTCFGKFPSLEAAESATGRRAAVRFRAPTGAVTFQDGFAGEFKTDVAHETGDFTIAKRDGAAAYQLAVVVDDAAQGITTVLRGDDLLPSTARQALLQDALGLPTPTWFHVPLVVDETGQRLAKRTDALSLASLRERGADPRAIVAWAASTSGLEPGARPTPRDLIPSFSLNAVPSHPPRLDPQALESIQSGPA